MSNTRKRLAIGAASLLAVVAPACSSDSKSDSGSTNSTSGGAAAAGVTIENRQYSSNGLTAKTEFTVTNKDGVGHTFTDDNGAFNVEVPGGGSATLTIDAPGTYNVHCEIHSSMHGTITVG